MSARGFCFLGREAGTRPIPKGPGWRQMGPDHCLPRVAGRAGAPCIPEAGLASGKGSRAAASPGRWRWNLEMREHPSLVPSCRRRP